MIAEDEPGTVIAGEPDDGTAVELLLAKFLQDPADARVDLFNHVAIQAPAAAAGELR